MLSVADKLNIFSAKERLPATGVELPVQLELRVMARHRFSPAVSVETARHGKCCAVNSVEKAAEQLLEWPEHGPEWRQAIAACADAMTGEMSAAEARSAFLDAAKAAGRLLPH
ncbi:DUF982 domain-containing protein [Bosea sp. LjRoot237]|uniref:DUF982 domain-containing protein n=1 Tax=Bosea sp. LjRoot237 TaxID=3342292 RepID=UPI003ECDB1F1